MHLIGILYSDEYLTVCVKPQGVRSEDEMPSLLMEQTGKEHFCVHRLDQAVGGVMVYARSGKAAAALSEAFASHTAVKQYIAAVSGDIPDEGEMRDLLFHDRIKNKTYVVKKQRKGVKEAVLSYRVLARAGDVTFCAVTLMTGRSHQIRVQFASRHYPLLGDVRYGSTVKSCPIALWSCRLRFPHPVKHDTVDITYPPPDTDPWKKLQGNVLTDRDI